MVILTKLTKKEFDDIINEFNLGGYVSHKHNTNALVNTVYELKTNKGKYVVKIFDGSPEKVVAFQTHLLHLLTTAKIATPPLVRTIHGQDYIMYNHKPLMVQNFFSGLPPKKLTNNKVKDFGITIARIHQLLSRQKGGNYWENNHELIKRKLVSKLNTFQLNKEFLKILANTKKLNLKKMKKGIIHSDLHSENLLANNNRIVVIDWDDAHRDFYAYELAVFIFDILIKPKIIYKNQIKIFLKSYESIIFLNAEEKKAIYYFIGHRLLTAMHWGINQLKRHPDLKKKIESWLFEFVAKYKNFYKLSLEDFLKIVN